ncbi:MAG: hypothetical protein MI799_15160 [Desulfobacterales bacterium]|nr:hypothetical protein [Desulfobacterales bacterium]
MQLDQNPFFRKPITPWYDSNPACIILMVIMVPVMLFALVGIWMALTDSRLAGHAWFPGLLFGLSFFLIFKVYFRMKRRNRIS